MSKQKKLQDLVKRIKAGDADLYPDMYLLMGEMMTEAFKPLSEDHILAEATDLSNPTEPKSDCMKCGGRHGLAEGCNDASEKEVKPTFNTQAIRSILNNCRNEYAPDLRISDEYEEEVMAGIKAYFENTLKLQRTAPKLDAGRKSTPAVASPTEEAPLQELVDIFKKLDNALLENKPEGVHGYVHPSIITNKTKAQIQKLTNQAVIKELENFEPFFKGDHSNCIDKMNCIGYMNAQNDFDNEREISIKELKTLKEKAE